MKGKKKKSNETEPACLRNAICGSSSVRLSRLAGRLPWKPVLAGRKDRLV